jgi:probable F420-dependent oxidoreductase
VKFGMGFANTSDAVTRRGATELAAAAEEIGLESLWTVDHVVVPAGYRSPYPYSRSGRMAQGVEDFDLSDPLVWLAFTAAVTERVQLGTGVVVLPQRNPLVLAKQSAGLDLLSGGRFILGVGSGWLAEEFAALGVPFEDRGARTDDHIRALRALWTEGTSSYHGEYVSFEEVYSRPLPVQRPIPIVVGGHSRRAARRAGELGDGFFPNGADRDHIAGLIEHARRIAERAGRDPAALEVTVGSKPDRESVERWMELGVDRIVIPPVGPDGLRLFAEHVIAAVS